MDNTNKKSFWERPEGKTGYLFLGLGALAVAWFLPSIAAMTALLAAIAANFFYTVMFGIATVATLFTIFNPRFQLLASVSFKLAMKFFTNIVWNLDPVGVLEELASKAKDKRDNLIENIKKAKEGDTKVKRLVAAQEAEIEQCNQMAEQAKRNQDVDAHKFQMQQAGLLLEANKEYAGMLKENAQILEILNKMKVAGEYKIQELEAIIKIQKNKRAIILPSYSAMKSAWSLINGGKDEKALWDETMEYLVDDYSAKMGSIMDGMEQAQQYVTNMDMKTGIREQNALQYFSEWEKKAESQKLLTGPSNAYTPRVPDQLVDMEHVVATNNSFDDLFNK